MHVDNAAHWHVRAMTAMEKDNSPVPGNFYCISYFIFILIIFFLYYYHYFYFVIIFTKFNYCLMKEVVSDGTYNALKFVRDVAKVAGVRPAFRFPRLLLCILFYIITFFVYYFVVFYYSFYSNILLRFNCIFCGGIIFIWWRIFHKQFIYGNFFPLFIIYFMLYLFVAGESSNCKDGQYAI